LIGEREAVLESRGAVRYNPNQRFRATASVVKKRRGPTHYGAIGCNQLQTEPGE
jgi:hypothetical protein